MAINIGGINGGFSGKVGSVVGYNLRGTWVMRSRPKPSPKNKRGSADQKKCRSRFSQIQYFLEPILPFIRVGFNLEGRRNSNSAHNSAKSFNMLNAFDEHGEINYSAARVCSGDLLGAEDVTAELIADELTVSWRDNSAEGSGRDTVEVRKNDQVMLLVYNVSHNKAQMVLSGAKRQQCREVIKMDRRPQPLEYHIWISFIADDRQRIANSVYCGTVVVDKLVFDE